MSIGTKVKPKGKSIDQKYYGDEPIIVGTPDETQLIHAFNWYNYMHSVDIGKKWLLDYLKKTNRSDQIIKEIKNAPDWRTVTTTCWMARMMLNGTVFNEKYMERFEDRLRENALYGIKQEKTTNTKVISVQDRTQAKIKQLLCDCEEAIDNNPSLDIYQWLTKNEVSTQAATAICDFYSKWLVDFQYEDKTLSKEDKNKNSQQLKYWTQFIYNCERYIGNKKVTKPRKPRATKVKTSADLTKKVQFQKEDTQLKIVSVNPQKIIGASTVWVYNTKYKKIGVYHSSSPKGFSIKGTTIVGFDVEKSKCKTLRKPEIQLAEFMSLGKVGLRKFLDTVNTTETPLTGRLNSDTIILKST